MSDTISKDFRAWLVTRPEIAQSVDGRVFEDDVPEDDKPYIVFSQSGQLEDIDLSGEGGLIQTTFDMEVRADTKAEADTIAKALKRHINGFPKADEDERTWNGRDISIATVNDHSKDYEVMPVGSFETDAIHALIIEVQHG